MSYIDGKELDLRSCNDSDANMPGGTTRGSGILREKLSTYAFQEMGRVIGCEDLAWLGTAEVDAPLRANKLVTAKPLGD